VWSPASGAWALLALALYGGCGPGPEPELDRRALLASDHRVAELLRPCTRSGFYSRDVSDLLAVLVEKLESGKTEPLKRAKEELGMLGSEAGVALQRLVERNASNAMQAPLVENAMDAAGFNMSDEAHQVLLTGLTFAQESIRRQALTAMAARHGRPEDFDLLLERIEGFETVENRRVAVRALYKADRPRAEALVLGWLESGDHRGLWVTAVPPLSRSRTPDNQRLAAGLYAELPPRLGVQVAAAAAGGGSGEALAFLLAQLESEVPQDVRTLAVQALGEAGLYDELGLALEDPSEAVRVIALDQIARAELEDIEERILPALDDPSPKVRGLALKHLVALGNQDARARALALLEEEPAIMQVALHAISQPIKEDEVFARQVWERLLERHLLEEHRPLAKRTATYKAMGLVPLADAALFLHRLGLESRGETIESLDAHDWMMIQASNTGEPGRMSLVPLLRETSDPRVRIGLIGAIGSTRDDFAREALLGHLSERQHDPLEVLYTASRLIRIGPSWKVASALKRASYEIQDDLEARRALQCLLWQWY